MNTKQISLRFVVIAAMGAAVMATSWIVGDSVAAESLSYNLACKDESTGLSVTKQPDEHQVVIKCKSGAKVTYINNGSQATKRVAASCPGSENVGSKVDTPNKPTSSLTLYCVNVTLVGGEPQSVRTNNMPTTRVSTITPESDEEPTEGVVLNDPVAGDDCGGVKTAIIKCDAGNSGKLSDNGIWALLLIAINVMTAGVGVLAVGGIVYGAIMYTTAEDKPDQVKKAVEIIRNVVIGLVIFALMWAGLNFIIPGGVFAA